MWLTNLDLYVYFVDIEAFTRSWQNLKIDATQFSKYFSKVYLNNFSEYKYTKNVSADFTRTINNLKFDAM